MFCPLCTTQFYSKLENMLNSSTSALIIAPPSRWRDSLRVLLLASGKITHVSQVDDALTHLPDITAPPPDLVLLSARSSDGSLWQTVRELKRQCPQMRCVALVHTRDQERLAREAGVDALLPEGFTTEELFSVIETVIE